ncbi:hypothetical protein MMC25_006743 [Agyrium rufum]|nr:hypothetical protein [Agyrium rufum]
MSTNSLLQLTYTVVPTSDVPSTTVSEYQSTPAPSGSFASGASTVAPPASSATEAASSAASPIPVSATSTLACGPCYIQGEFSITSALGGVALGVSTTFGSAGSTDYLVLAAYSATNTISTNGQCSVAFGSAITPSSISSVAISSGSSPSAYYISNAEVLLLEGLAAQCPQAALVFGSNTTTSAQMGQITTSDTITTTSIFITTQSTSSLISTSDAPAQITDSPSSSNTAPPSGLSNGAKIGIGIGVALTILLALLIAVIILWRQKRRRSYQSAPLSEEQEEKDKIYNLELPSSNPVRELHASDLRYELQGGNNMIHEKGHRDREAYEMSAYRE